MTVLRLLVWQPFGTVFALAIPLAGEWATGGSGWVSGVVAAICFAATLDRLLKARRVRRWERADGERLLFESGPGPDPVWRRRAFYLGRQV